MKEGKFHCGIATLVSSSSLIGSLHKKSSPRRCCNIMNKTSDHSPKSCGSSVTFRNKCDHPSIRSAMERSKKVSTTARKVDQSPFFPNRRRSGSFQFSSAMASLNNSPVYESHNSLDHPSTLRDVRGWSVVQFLRMQCNIKINQNYLSDCTIRISFLLCQKGSITL